MIRLENRFSAEDSIPVVEIEYPFSHYDDPDQAEEILNNYFPCKTIEYFNGSGLEDRFVIDYLSGRDLMEVPKILLENTSCEALDVKLDYYTIENDPLGRLRDNAVGWQEQFDYMGRNPEYEVGDLGDEGWLENGVRGLENG